MNVSTIEFELSHGKRPRGVGRWAFATRRNPLPQEIFWSDYATYGQAKRQAVARFGRTTTIYLLP